MCRKEEKNLVKEMLLINTIREITPLITKKKMKERIKTTQNKTNLKNENLLSWRKKACKIRKLGY